ncbi:Psoralen synthase [Heracleum sosnowskyi]|uniref:Psoralen synthase n=1 Tax=Heracleum sosnowskyi TaxID=360622 RepID=A0AAD8I930_9APIA|nr:Psoralen synthase [Heracleum sosnowskyi]
MKMLEQSPLYLYFFSLSLATIFLYKWLTLRKAAVKNLPPSPPKVPIIGNLHQIGPDPHVSLRDLAQKYGPLMLLKFGSVPVVVVSSADAAQEILKTNDLVFSDRPTLSVPNRIFYNGRDVGFARYSEYWRQLKSACVTQLLSSSRVHSFHNVREEEVALLIQNIQHPHSKLVNLSDLLAELTNNVVCRVALGRKYYSVYKGKSYKILFDELMKMLGYSRSIGDFFPWLGWVDWLSGLKGKVEKAANEIDTFLEGVLRDHTGTTVSNNGCANKDFVSILLEIQNTDAGSSIDRECIKALILDIFAAGTETTSTTLEWTIAALIKSPQVMFKLQNEFDFELPDGERLEDLDMTGVSGITLRRKSPLLVVARPHV